MEAPHDTYQSAPLVGAVDLRDAKRSSPFRGVAVAAAALLALAGAAGALRGAAPELSTDLMASKGECDVSLDFLQVPDGKNASMLWAHMGVTVVSTCTTDVDVLVKYKADGSTMADLWASKATLVPGGTGTFTLARLRPKAKYGYWIYVSQSGKANENMYVMLNGTFTSASTGVPRFDDGPLATVTGTPSWQTLSFKYAADVAVAKATDAVVDQPSGPTRRLQDAPAVPADDDDAAGFAAEGLVAIDTEGYVVFYYRGTGIVAWDGTDAETLVLTKELEGGTKAYVDGDGNTWTGDTAFLEIDAKGIMQHQTVVECSGKPLNSNGLTHEAAYDKETGNVLSLMSKYGRFPNVTVLDTAGHYKAENFVGESVVMWNRHKGTYETVLDVFDYATPEKDMFASPAWYKEAKKESCSGKKKIEAVEFSKLDSVSVGPSGNYVVTSKNLNAIFSFSRNPVALEWTLSPSIDSDYAFDKAADAFYGPQGARQLADGSLLVFDGGYGRPGCGDSNDAATKSVDGCFSRVARYSLAEAASKHDAATATLEWQFEYPRSLEAGANATTSADGGHALYEQAMLHDLYNPIGGSVYELDKGTFLLAFAEGLANDRKYNMEGSIVAVEVDKHGNVDALVDVPHSVESGDLSSMGSYRVLPWATIAGETVQFPSDKTIVESKSSSKSPKL